MTIFMAFDGGWLGISIALLIIGLVCGFFIARKLMQNELKKHPPIDEAQIRAMFMAMGRKPSEAQIKSVMKSMQQDQK